jgi:hypothetical protein
MANVTGSNTRFKFQKGTGNVLAKARRTRRKGLGCSVSAAQILGKCCRGGVGSNSLALFNFEWVNLLQRVEFDSRGERRGRGWVEWQLHKPVMEADQLSLRA